MPHVRTQIRERAAALLAGTSVGSNVFIGLSWPTSSLVLPCYHVITPSETTMADTMSPVRQARSLRFSVYARAEGSDERALLAKLDEMAAEVEQRLLVFDDWNGLVQAVNLIGTTTRVEAADIKKGELQLDFLAQYATTETQPHIAV